MNTMCLFREVEDVDDLDVSFFRIAVDFFQRHFFSEEFGWLLNVSNHFSSSISSRLLSIVGDFEQSDALRPFRSELDDFRKLYDHVVDRVGLWKQERVGRLD